MLSVKPKSSSVAGELILYLIAAVVLVAVAYAIVFDRSALAPAGDGIIGSFTSIFSSFTTGFTNVISGMIHTIISTIENALSNTGSYLYKHTIGAL